MKHCVECDSPIEPGSLSFEQRLIDDQDFCRRCFDEIISDEDMPYLKSPGLMSLPV
jgi:hypothetical protein